MSRNTETVPAVIDPAVILEAWEYGSSEHLAKQVLTYVRKAKRWFAYCDRSMAAQRAGREFTEEPPPFPSKPGKHRMYDRASTLEGRFNLPHARTIYQAEVNATAVLDFLRNR